MPVGVQRMVLPWSDNYKNSLSNFYENKDKSIILVDRLVNMKYGTCFARFNALADYELKEDQCAILKYDLTNKQPQFIVCFY
jgi:hypothetical protein